MYENMFELFEDGGMRCMGEEREPDTGDTLSQSPPHTPPPDLKLISLW